MSSVDTPVGGDNPEKDRSTKNRGRGKAGQILPVPFLPNRVNPAVAFQDPCNGVSGKL